MSDQDCLYCHETFSRNKYSPRQKVCSKAECQHKRQIDSMREWRQRHPNYFKYDESKGDEWLKTQRERSRVWRQRNPDKIRVYRQTHIDDYRKYMRDYMRRYRDHKKKIVEIGEDIPVQKKQASEIQLQPKVDPSS